MDLLLAEVLHDLRLHALVGDDDEMPGLRVRPGGRVARGLEDHGVVLVRNDLRRIEGARRHPAADHVHQRIIPVPARFDRHGRCSFAHLVTLPFAGTLRAASLSAPFAAAGAPGR